MKTIQTMFVFALALTLSTASFAANQKVDSSKSTVRWLGKKMTGEHTGTIGVKEGTLVVENGKVTGGNVVIDMNSIIDTDLSDPGYNAKLIGHLKSDDFFSVATNPTAELAVTKVENNGNSHTFTGTLTIKGITNPVSFTATSAKDGKFMMYKGTLTVDRTKYNVRYGSKSFFENLGDKVIFDDFTLDFNLAVFENLN